jgi:hypothetical protein
MGKTAEEKVMKMESKGKGADRLKSKRPGTKTRMKTTKKATGE